MNEDGQSDRRVEKMKRFRTVLLAGELGREFITQVTEMNTKLW
jgi:hypothetical protein